MHTARWAHTGPLRRNLHARRPGVNECVRACEVSVSVVSDSLQPHQSARQVLCPGDSPGKNAGVGCHSLLQGISPTQGSNPRLPCLLQGQASPLPLSHLRSPLQAPLCSLNFTPT